MEWTSQALILSIKKLGETSTIVELMTQSHGRAKGVVRNGRSKRMRPILQQGNTVEATWRARLEDQLGTFIIEPQILRASDIMASRTALAALQHLTQLLHLLAEREPHAGLYHAAEVILEHANEPQTVAALMIRFELAMLDELGFGLDLTKCAATGCRDDLAYVSPKSGRAVSRSAGEPYKDKLFALPLFLLGQSGSYISAQEMQQAMAITDYFLNKYAFAPRMINADHIRKTFSKCIQ